MARLIFLLSGFCLQISNTERRSFKGESVRLQLLESVASLLKEAGTEGFNASADAMIGEFSKVMSSAASQHTEMKTELESLGSELDSMNAKTHVVDAQVSTVSDLTVNDILMERQMARPAQSAQWKKMHDASKAKYLQRLQTILEYAETYKALCTKTDKIQSLLNGLDENGRLPAEVDRQNEWTLAAFSSCTLQKAKEGVSDVQQACQQASDYVGKVGLLDWKTAKDVLERDEYINARRTCSLNKWKFGAFWVNVKGKPWTGNEVMPLADSDYEMTFDLDFTGSLDELLARVKGALVCRKAPAVFAQGSEWQSQSAAAKPMWFGDEAVMQSCSDGCSFSVKLSGVGSVEFNYILSGSSTAKSSPKISVSLGDKSVEAGADDPQTFSASFVDGGELKITASGGVMSLSNVAVKCSGVFN